MPCLDDKLTITAITSHAFRRQKPVYVKSTPASDLFEEQPLYFDGVRRVEEPIGGTAYVSRWEVILNQSYMKGSPEGGYTVTPERLTEMCSLHPVQGETQEDIVEVYDATGRWLAFLEDVNDETISVYQARQDGNPVNQARLSRQKISAIQPLRL